jgi:tetratricopeptide (TPR) repeat protein
MTWKVSSCSKYELMRNMFKKMCLGVALNQVDHYIARADNFRDRADWPQACEFYRKALDLNKKLSHIWVQYGHALKECRRLKEAEISYKRALEIDNLNPDTHLQLGHLLKIQGRFREAIECYGVATSVGGGVRSAREELKGIGMKDAEIDKLHLALAGVASDSAEVTKQKITTAEYNGEQANTTFDEEDYRNRHPDVRCLVECGFIPSARLYSEIYGEKEGRSVLESLRSVPPSRVFIVCPSYDKRCGIGEHARYIALSLMAKGIEVHTMRRSSQLFGYDAAALKGSVIVVNHGPGLFDGHNPELSEGEATPELLQNLSRAFKRYEARPVIYLHSMLDSDNSVMFGRQEMLLNFPIPVATTILSAAHKFRIPWIDHGAQPLPSRYYDRPSQIPTESGLQIGFFGFFQYGGKDFDALINAGIALKAKLVGSVATKTEAELDQLQGILSRGGVECSIATGWQSDSGLEGSLEDAHIYYLPQKDYDHWNNSGTARFVMNFGRPVIVPPHQPFLDLRDAAVFCESDDLPRVACSLRNEVLYNQASSMSSDYRVNTSMESTMYALVTQLPKVVENQMSHGFFTPSSLAEQVVSRLPKDIAASRLSAVKLNATDWLEATNSGKTFRFAVADEIQVWRKHYELSEITYVNTQDVIFGVYRALLKRDPGFFEYRIHRGNFPSCSVTSANALDYANGVYRVVNDVVAVAEDPSSGVDARIWLDSEALTLDSLKARKNEIVLLLKGYLDQAMICSRPTTTDRSVGDFIGSRNLLDIIARPHYQLKAAINDSLSMAGLGVRLEVEFPAQSIRANFVRAIECLSDIGVDVSACFLLDSPLVPLVVPRKYCYSYQELFLHDGDEFIFDVVRSLMKRNPLAPEVFEMRRLLLNAGKASVIQWYTSGFNVNAFVDNEDLMPAEQIAVCVAGDPEYKRLVSDFRSPVAGGWKLRNRYLESKRNFSRNWLRVSKGMDRWWGEAGQVEAFLSV